jgi:hypothetical protein
VENLILDFTSPCGGYRLTFEDNGKVAYAYLKNPDRVVGAVWLYNRCPTPDVSEWKDRANIPFANCKGYMSEEGHLTAHITADNINVDWEDEDDQPVAYVYVFEDLFGVVGVNDHPGYARHALKDSPLARVMEIE